MPILEDNTPKDAFIALKGFAHSSLALEESSDRFRILYLAIFTLLYLLSYSM